MFLVGGERPARQRANAPNTLSPDPWGYAQQHLSPSLCWQHCTQGAYNKTCCRLLAAHDHSGRTPASQPRLQSNSGNAAPRLQASQTEYRGIKTADLGSDHFIIGGGGWKTFWKNNLALLLAQKNNLAQPVRWKNFFALICCKKK